MAKHRSLMMSLKLAVVCAIVILIIHNVSSDPGRRKSNFKKNVHQVDQIDQIEGRVIGQPIITTSENNLPKSIVIPLKLDKFSNLFLKHTHETTKPMKPPHYPPR